MRTMKLELLQREREMKRRSESSVRLEEIKIAWNILRSGDVGRSIADGHWGELSKS